MYNNIKGINRIIKIKPDFIWHHLIYIESLNYSIDYNDYGDKVSYLDIKFLMEDKNSVLIKFSEVNCFKIKNLGGSYNQVMGFEIVDQKVNGFESDNRYLIRDYEKGIIKFFCSSIEIVSVIKNDIKS